jgi:hypothetical protein
MATISELLTERRDLAARIERLEERLAAVDRQLFSRIEKMAAAVEGRELPKLATAIHAQAIEDLAKSSRASAVMEVVRALGAMGPVGPAATGGTKSGAVTVRVSGPDGRVYSQEAPLPTPPPALEERTDVARVIEAVRAILLSAFAPVPTGELYERLLAQGIRIVGARPKNTLSAHLSNRKELFTSTPTGWVLRTNPATSTEGTTATEA